jgi:hypothetical protein
MQPPEMQGKMCIYCYVGLVKGGEVGIQERWFGPLFRDIWQPGGVTTIWISTTAGIPTGSEFTYSSAAFPSKKNNSFAPRKLVPV